MKEVVPICYSDQHIEVVDVFFSAGSIIVKNIVDNSRAHSNSAKKIK